MGQSIQVKKVTNQWLAFEGDFRYSVRGWFGTRKRPVFRPRCDADEHRRTRPRGRTGPLSAPRPAQPTDGQCNPNHAPGEVRHTDRPPYRINGSDAAQTVPKREETADE